MDASFAGAAAPTPAAQQLVFTSDWQKTIIDMGQINFALLEFLSDAKKAGHRVIICSSMQMHKIHDLFKLVIDVGRKHGYDILDMDQFEMITKGDLKAMGLKSDYSFDDEYIDAQLVSNYVDAGLEITVGEDFTMSPLNMEQLRAFTCLPRDNKKGSEPSLPTRAPEAFK